MRSVYDIVTDRIMELLEQGEIPWKKPWQSSGGPKNLISKKSYRGINSFLLNCSPFNSPYWLTFKQASEKGGHVRKGEKSTVVVFWKWLEVKDTEENEENSSQQTNGKIPLLRYYRVWNLEQTEGIPHPAEQQITNEFTPIDRAEQIISQMPNRPDIQYGGDRAAYSPMLDVVKMPKPETFDSPESFYGVLFHELGHATGHEKRLARKSLMEPSYFGSHEYAKDELVAEFASAMLCGHSGIENATIFNSASYIQGWLKTLRNDSKLAIIAAGQAQRAADYILGRKEE